jgi:hypothetical protein
MIASFSPRESVTYILNESLVFLFMGFLTISMMTFPVMFACLYPSIPLIIFSDLYDSSIENLSSLSDPKSPNPCTYVSLDASNVKSVGGNTTVIIAPAERGIGH